jgi:hypothetical protein
MDNTQQRELLMQVYECGNYYELLEKLTGINNKDYTRHQARDLISSFINNNWRSREKQPALLHMPNKLIQDLVSHLITEVKGSKVELDNPGPHLEII